jgi:hypothetical protein
VLNVCVLKRNRENQFEREREKVTEKEGREPVRSFCDQTALVPRWAGSLLIESEELAFLENHLDKLI